MSSDKRPSAPGSAQNVPKLSADVVGGGSGGGEEADPGWRGRVGHWLRGVSWTGGEPAAAHQEEDEPAPFDAPKSGGTGGSWLRRSWGSLMGAVAGVVGGVHPQKTPVAEANHDKTSHVVPATSLGRTADEVAMPATRARRSLASSSSASFLSFNSILTDEEKEDEHDVFMREMGIDHQLPPDECVRPNWKKRPLRLVSRMDREEKEALVEATLMSPNGFLRARKHHNQRDFFSKPTEIVVDESGELKIPEDLEMADFLRDAPYVYHDIENLEMMMREEPRVPAGRQQEAQEPEEEPALEQKMEFGDSFGGEEEHLANEDFDWQEQRVFGEAGHFGDLQGDWNVSQQGGNPFEDGSDETLGATGEVDWDSPMCQPINGSFAEPAADLADVCVEEEDRQEEQQSPLPSSPSSAAESDDFYAGVDWDAVPSFTSLPRSAPISARREHFNRNNDHMHQSIGSLADVITPPLSTRGFVLITRGEEEDDPQVLQTLHLRSPTSTTTGECDWDEGLLQQSFGSGHDDALQDQEDPMEPTHAAPPAQGDSFPLRLSVTPSPRRRRRSSSVEEADEHERPFPAKRHRNVMDAPPTPGPSGSSSSPAKPSPRRRRRSSSIEEVDEHERPFPAKRHRNAMDAPPTPGPSGSSSSPAKPSPRRRRRSSSVEEADEHERPFPAKRHRNVMDAPPTPGPSGSSSSPAKPSPRRRRRSSSIEEVDEHERPFPAKRHRNAMDAPPTPGPSGSSSSPSASSASSVSSILIIRRKRRSSDDGDHQGDAPKRARGANQMVEESLALIDEKMAEIVAATESHDGNAALLDVLTGLKRNQTSLRRMETMNPADLELWKVEAVCQRVARLAAAVPAAPPAPLPRLRRRAGMYRR